MPSWFNDGDQEEVVIYIKPIHVLNCLYIKPIHVLNCLLVKRGNSIKVRNLVKYDLIQIDPLSKKN